MGFRNRIVRISQLIADSITGAAISTAASGARWVLSSGVNSNTIAGYTGNANESVPAQILVDVNGAALELLLRSPFYNGFSNAIIALQSFAAKTAAIIQADSTTINDHTGLEYFYADDNVARIKGALTAAGAATFNALVSILNGVKIGATGATLSGFDMGNAAVTTGATGQAVIACNLPAAPFVVFAECVSNSGNNVVTASYTSTGFSAIVHTAAGALVANTAVTIRWAAFC